MDLLRSLFLMLFVLILAVLTWTCKKEYIDKNPTPLDKLPAISSIGANTLGCLVQNQPYAVNYDVIDGKPTIKAEFDKTYREMYIASFAVGSEGKSSSLGLTIVNLQDTGMYNVEYYNAAYTKYFVADSPKVYRPDLFFPNRIHVTHLDTLKKIVSGTFELKVVIPQTEQGLRLMNGRFDVKYSVLH